MESSMTDGDGLAYDVTGMSCEHCVAAVKAKVGEIAGVNAVDVDLAGGVVLVRGSGVDSDAVRVAIEAAGYGPAERALGSASASA
jgi:copper chaperone